MPPERSFPANGHAEKTKQNNPEQNKTKKQSTKQNQKTPKQNLRCGKAQSSALQVKQHGKPPNTSPQERMLSCRSLSVGAKRPKVTGAFFPFFF